MTTERDKAILSLMAAGYRYPSQAMIQTQERLLRHPYTAPEVLNCLRMGFMLAASEQRAPGDESLAERTVAQAKKRAKGNVDAIALDLSTRIRRHPTLTEVEKQYALHGKPGHEDPPLSQEAIAFGKMYDKVSPEAQRLLRTVHVLCTADLDTGEATLALIRSGQPAAVVKAELERRLQLHTGISDEDKRWAFYGDARLQ